ncbi:MAG: radical SAM protein [Nitrospirae bacterium YQR-1]
MTKQKIDTAKLINSPVKVGLVQINFNYGNEYHIPYSVGLLQAYAMKYLKRPDDFKFLLPIYKRLPVDSAVEYLLETDIVFFSTYVWNRNISFEIARRLKQIKAEEIITVFGGPQIPVRNTEAFLRTNPQIDIACHGEGERVVLAVLESFHKKTWVDVPSVSFIDKDNNFVHTPEGRRIIDLDEIPSPYLEGVFEPLMEANLEDKWLVLWETNRGCPFTCAYCDWSATKRRLNQFGTERLYREMDWVSRHRIRYLICCDSNFGILPRDMEIVKYLAENKIKHGYPEDFSMSNTKNTTERIYNIHKIMAGAKMSKGVYLAMQSLNEDTLKFIKRSNISNETFLELQRRFSRERIETFTDLIIPLPGETYESFTEGVSTIIENGQYNSITFSNLSILTNADMADPEYQKTFGMEIVEIKASSLHISIFEDEVTEVQQLVVATNTMPGADYIKAKIFIWMVRFLFFDKLLQIPLVIVNKLYGLRYNDIIESFIAQCSGFRLLCGVYGSFVKKAHEIQGGGAYEFIGSKEWLNIWWAVEELAIIELCTENKLDDFYGECKEVLFRILYEKGAGHFEVPIEEAIILNRHLIKLPFKTENIDITLSHNIYDFYRAVVTGQHVPFEKKLSTYRIDRTTNTWASWQQWCKEVIWYGSKRGAYIYGCSAVV